MKTLLISWVIAAIVAIKIWNKNAKEDNPNTRDFLVNIVKQIKETFK